MRNEERDRPSLEGSRSYVISVATPLPAVDFDTIIQRFD